MDNIEFKNIESIKEYLTTALESGKLIPNHYQKSCEITARVGVLGEQIITIMEDGLQETKNTVTADENGNPGWVVTNPSGEQYIVSHSVFVKKYEKTPQTENRFRPVWNPITAAKIDENICFVASWGETMNLVAGGYLVFNEQLDDIYGVQQKEFEKTYKLV